jgi:hypothetical protein
VRRLAFELSRKKTVKASAAAAADAGRLDLARA